MRLIHSNHFIVVRWQSTKDSRPPRLEGSAWVFGAEGGVAAIVGEQGELVPSVPSCPLQLINSGDSKLPE